MWGFLVRLILRNRLANLIVILIITAFFASRAKVDYSYEVVQMMPDTDSTIIEYNQFKRTFGQDGNILYIGIRDSMLFTPEHYAAWHALTYKLKENQVVEDVLSVARVFSLVKDEERRVFTFSLMNPDILTTAEQLDSMKQEIYKLHFFDGLLFNSKTGASFMAVTIKKEMLNHKDRNNHIKALETTVLDFSKETGTQVHLSGLPYIRTKTSMKIQKELILFTILALVIASIALYFFFRSFKAVIFPLIIVIISVIWGVGLMSLFGYQITILTGILPPLVIIICVENCIFLLNKYHYEYRLHGNKVKALTRIIDRTGKATFLTNLTTAVGFAAFIITQNHLLVEFGIVAAINIMFIFVLCLFLIPIFFSYLDPPEPRHLKHMDSRLTVGLINRIVQIVLHKRRRVYITATVFLIAGVVGVFQLKTTGRVVDDIPQKDRLYKDLMFFEEEFNGVLPFEITVDTRKKRGVLQSSTLNRIVQLEDTLALYPEFSKPLSVAGVVKFARQAFYDGDPDYYDMPTSRDRSFIMAYIPKADTGRRTILNSFIDSSMQITRISVQMANIGTHEIQAIKNDLKPRIDAIFPPDTYDVSMTGTSLVYLKGTDYLVENLLYSLILALIAITLLMALLFSSIKMIAISLLPNLLPQILTAALMGYFGIPIKPSTILIFSIALGISVDNTIHFLSRYRHHLKYNCWNIQKSVVAALQESGYSMIYSSVVLFLGFSIFTLSTFGGTVALGFLISFTLIAAACSNLFLLPSLLLWLDKRITTRSFEEPIIELFNEGEDSEEIFEEAEAKPKQ